MASHEQIREFAYFIWKDEGCPNGRDLEHYFYAKQVLEEKEADEKKSKIEVSLPEEAKPQPKGTKRRSVRSTKPRARKSKE